ncbi:MAG: hypothetical protein EOO07_36650 [Chitinophagaceae bacterium]|nr:MAG: hypothetical protein EOO07_36650 [Chitinophagaceae bacterium]
MKYHCLLALMLASAVPVLAQEKFTPPATPAKPVKDTLHNVILTNNYRWLEDKTNADVIAWTKAQHDYGIKYLQSTQKVHPDLKGQIATYFNLDYEGPLKSVGKRIFQTVKLKGDKQHKIYTYLNGKKLLVWDPVKLDTSGKTANTATDYTYNGENFDMHYIYQRCVQKGLVQEKNLWEGSTAPLVETKTKYHKLVVGGEMNDALSRSGKNNIQQQNSVFQTNAFSNCTSR